MFEKYRQEILEILQLTTKNLFRLFTRKSSIDLNDMGFNSATMNGTRTTGNKYYNTITTSNFGLSTAEQNQLNELSSQYFKLTHNDQYAIIHKLSIHLVDIYKTLEQKHYLPKLQYLQFVFDLMETNSNIFNLILFAIRLLHVGPLIEQYMRNKFWPSGHNGNTRICYFEYVSYFYLNLIGVFRLHLLSLALWKDLATEVFGW